MVQITFLRNRCIGCDACVASMPERWELGEDGKSNLIEGHLSGDEIYIVRVGEDELDKLLEVAASCPDNVIRIKKL